MSAAVLIVHVVAGSVGLLLGPVVMYLDTRRFAAGHRVAGRWTDAYILVVLVVCLTGSGLVVLDRPDLWWLVPVSALTFGLATLARDAARRRYRGWSHGYVHGIGGSYIAQVTALVVVWLVVNGPLRGGLELLPWLLPTVLGTVLIEVWRRRLVRSVSVPDRAART